MSYRTIISEFEQLGYNENSKFGSQQIYTELCKLMRKYGANSFNEEIHNQIWDQCAKDAQGAVFLHEYAKVIMEAKQILQHRLEDIDIKLNQKINERREIEKQLIQARTVRDERSIQMLTATLTLLEDQISNLEEDKKDSSSDLQNILYPFSRDDPSYRASVHNRSGVLSRSGINEAGYTVLPTNNSQIPPILDNTRTHSQIFIRRSSKALVLLFSLAMILVLLEMFIMLHKYHFYGLMFGLSVVAIFGLNYFDKLYIRFLMGASFLGIVLDVMWLIVKWGDYWLPGDFSEDSRLNYAFYKLIVFIMLALIFLKFVIFCILLSYMNNKEIQAVNICGYSITLTGEYDHNPISSLFYNV